MPLKRVLMRELAEWSWTTSLQMSEDGKSASRPGVDDIAAGVLLELVRRVPDGALAAILAELRAANRQAADLLRALSPPRADPAPDPGAARALRLAECRRRAWVAYKRAGGTMSLMEGDEAADPTDPVSVLGLSVRARKVLNRIGCKTVGDLAARTEAELMGCRNFGHVSLQEVRERLARVGLKLRGD